MRAAIIGCGNISRCHVSALQALPAVTLVAVADCAADRATKTAAAYGCRAYTDWRELLEQEAPDAVHICTPHHLHVEMATEALRRGIHVLCEKPCAITAQSLQALRDAQTQSTAQFGVCFQNRYNAAVLRAKQMLAAEAYGKLQAVAGRVFWCRDASYYADDWHGRLATEGGGVLVNQAIHTEDLMRFLAGADVDTCTAHIANDHLQGVIEVEDSATVRLRYANGVMGQLDATTAFAHNAKVMIDLFCTAGVLRLEGDSLTFLGADGSMERLVQEGAAGVGKDYWGAGHPALIRDFYRSVQTGEPFPIDAFEGGKATEDFLRFYAAAGRAPVV